MDNTAEQDLNALEPNQAPSPGPSSPDITQTREIRLLADSAEAIGALDGLHREIERRRAARPALRVLPARRRTRSEQPPPLPPRAARKGAKGAGRRSGEGGQSKKVTAEDLVRIAVALGIEEQVRESLTDDTLQGERNPRPGERRQAAWRGEDENSPSGSPGSMDHTSTEDSGEYELSIKRGLELIEALRPKLLRSGQNATSSGRRRKG